MLTLKVEAIAGSEIEKTFDEATQLAKKLNCYVEFQFNGVTCCAHPDGNKKVGAERYHNEIVKKDGFKYAVNF